MSFSVNYPWLLMLASLVLATGGSFFLYYNNPLKITNRYVRLALYMLRFTLIFFLCFLLLGPLFKFISQKTEKPIVVLALDNSQSIINNKDLAYYKDTFLKEIEKLKQQLAKKYDLQLITFGQTQTPNGTLSYNEKQSNISDALNSVQNKNYNLNLAAVILASDGIYNRGSNPLYAENKSKSIIYTIALGDTLQRRDALIKQVKYNQLVYAGNAFETEVELKSFFCNNESLVLSVSENGKLITSRQIKVNSNSFFAGVPVTLPAAQEGLHVYSISIQKLNNEISYVNNEARIQVNVIKTKQKIFLLAQTPHPDVSAIRQCLASNLNYEVKFSLLSDYNNEWMDEASLFILHQLPGLRGEGYNLVAQLNKKNMPVFFIIGRQSGLNVLAQLSALQVAGPPENFNEAQSYYNPNFNLFQPEPNQQEMFGKLAPLITPYGTYKIPNDAAIFMYQQIGYVKTTAPLLFFSQSKGVQSAYFCGEGFWRWHLQDFMLNGNHEFTQSLLNKTIRLVAGKNDKSRFRVNTAKNIFDENEPVQVEVELYNDAYELINEPEVSIVFLNENGKKYAYNFSKTEKAYQLETGNLPPGIYQYEAKVSGSNKYEKKTGKFTVSALQAEFLQTRADHQLLYNLAEQNGGSMFYPHQLDDLYKELTKNENIKPVIFEQNEVKELMHQKWIFALLILMMSSEWFIRKWNGFI
ncbi:MAG: hypothetical protein Q8M15_10355 [Bacteroidota bacterium]|nr:hypothetical protein [Bacteroidota bacterium]